MFVTFTLKAVIPFRPDFFDTDVAVGGILFFFHGFWFKLRVVLVPSDCSNVTRRVSVVLQGLFKLEHDVASVAPGTTLSYELVLVSNPWNNPEVLDATYETRWGWGP